MAKILDVHLQALKSRDAIELRSDKWRILIPHVPAPASLRSNQLQEAIPEISPKVLTQSLCEIATKIHCADRARRRGLLRRHCRGAQGLPDSGQESRHVDETLFGKSLSCPWRTVATVHPSCATLSWG
jgi:HxlR-like helix-turn-helix